MRFWRLIGSGLVKGTQPTEAVAIRHLPSIFIVARKQSTTFGP